MVEFILHIINPCVGWWSLYSTLLIPVREGGVCTPHYYSLYEVVEFILHIINPCMESWSLYSTLLIPRREGGVYTPHAGILISVRG